MTQQSDEITVNVVRKPITRMYIRIGRDKTVTVSAPLSVPQEQIRAFVESKKPWLAKHLADMPDPVQYRYVDGETHYYLGHPAVLHIIRADETRTHFHNGKILMYVTPGTRNFKRVYTEWAKNQLWDLVAEFCDQWADRMDVEFSSINVKKMRSRWGSCNVKTGDLTFALDLITKPKACIEAVVVHELNHLLEKGHTDRFHKLMAHWLPDYKERDKVLRNWPQEFM